MKQEIYLCFRLKTVHAGLSAETGLGQCAVCKNTKGQKQGNQYIKCFSMSHKDFTIRTVISFFIVRKTIPQLTQSFNKIFCQFFHSNNADCFPLGALRACAKITSHFRIPSSGHLCPILNRKVLEIDPLFLWLCNFGSNKSDLNRGVAGVKGQFGAYST